jgi:hypothetical protein
MNENKTQYIKSHKLLLKQCKSKGEFPALRLLTEDGEEKGKLNPKQAGGRK